VANPLEPPEIPEEDFLTRDVQTIAPKRLDLFLESLVKHDKTNTEKSNQKDWQI